MKKLLLFLALLLACGTSGKWVVPPLPEEGSPVEIIILGDKYGKPMHGKFEQVYGVAVAEAPDVMVSIGDILDAGGLLSYPTLYTTGNHDDDEMIALGLPLYMDTLIAGVHFILIDNGSSATIDSTQMAWIEEVVQTPADWTLVFCHRMFWNYDMVDNQIYHELHDLFIANNVDAVFAGHHHRLFIPDHDYDGIEYINVGRTAGSDTRGKPSYEYKDTTYVLPDVEPYGYVKIRIGESMMISFVEIE